MIESFFILFSLFKLFLSVWMITTDGGNFSKGCLHETKSIFGVRPHADHGAAIILNIVLRIQLLLYTECVLYSD